MKKIIFTLILVVMTIINVEAKDTVYSINNYKDSEFIYIEKSYDNDLVEDGYVLGGNYLKEKIEKDDTTYNDYQVMLVKYNKYDKIVWKYTYGKTKEDYIDELLYSYNDEGKIDGYLILTKNTYDLEEINDVHSQIIKIDLEGKLVYEKGLDRIIDKIIPTYDLENNIVGYISISGSSVVKYNKNLDIEWTKDYDNSLSDICRVYDNNTIRGYAFIKDNMLLEIDLLGDNEKVITDKLTTDNTYKLVEANDGFMVYGITPNVKLNKGNNSYFIINYNISEVWESIGNVSLDKEEIISLLPVYEENKIKEYLLLYKNELDSSYEIIKINLNGEFIKKIKKINNGYYKFNSFTSFENTLYLVGQLNCPEDESCNYDSNFLYLVSDEDKVIEVEDNTSKVILVVVLGIIALVVGFIVIKSRKNSK